MEILGGNTNKVRKKTRKREEVLIGSQNMSKMCRGSSWIFYRQVLNCCLCLPRCCGLQESLKLPTPYQGLHIPEINQYIYTMYFPNRVEVHSVT